MFEDSTGAGPMCYSSESFTTDITTLRQHSTDIVHLAVRLVAPGEGENRIRLQRRGELRGISRCLESWLRPHETFNKRSLGHFARHVRIQGAAPLLEVVLSFQRSRSAS